MPDMSGLGQIFGSTGIGSIFSSPLLNPLVWVVVILVLVVFVFTVIKLRKRRKLAYPAAEIVDLGSGKTSINFIGSRGAGWFGKNRIFFGLWDKGDEVMRIKDMTIVEQFSETDFQEVNGRRGVVFYRHPVNKNLLPISKMEVVNAELLNTLAPIEFMETAVDIIKANEIETRDKWEKWAPVLVLAGVIIFAVISLIIVSQVFKHSITEASDLVLSAGKTCLESAKSVCTQIGLPAGGGAP